jgi:hypothetical protein
MYPEMYYIFEKERSHETFCDAMFPDRVYVVD